MKQLLAITLVVLLVSAFFATPIRRPINRKPIEAKPIERPQDVLFFLEGFIIGLEASTGDIEKCTRDIKMTLADFEEGFKNLEYGFKHIKVEMIIKGFENLGAGLEKIAQALKDCNCTGLVKEIEQLAADLKMGGMGVLKVLVHEVVNIFHHGKELSSDFKAAINFWKQKQWKMAGTAWGKIVGILLKY